MHLEGFLDELCSESATHKQSNFFIFLFDFIPFCNNKRECCSFSEQTLYVGADPSGAECHPVCHWTVAVPHLPPEIHSQSSTLLPWMDF